jgi:hypothetical protein
MRQVIHRVKKIMFQSHHAWDEIRSESLQEREIFLNYLIYVAAVPAVAGFLGSLFVKENFFRSLIWAFLFFGLSLGGVRVAAKVLNFWAPNFKAEHDYLSMLKLMAYSFTPIFLACIFFIIPPVHFFSVLGIFGFYTFWIGLPKLIPCPPQELFNFRFIGVIIIAIVILIVFTLSALISGTSVDYLSI